MNDDQYIEAAHIMSEMGGSFARHLGLAYLQADSDNAARVRQAFGHLFARYYRDFAAMKPIQQESKQ